MQLTTVAVATAACLLIASQVHARPAIPACPGLDEHGQRKTLIPAPVAQATLPEDDVQPVPSDLAVAARNAVSYFESGGGDAYANISRLDTISIGYLQWNWGTRSLINEFMAAVSDDEIAVAPDPLKADLEILKGYQQRGKSDEKAATAVIARWTSSAADDPLSGRIRKSVRVQLSAWLAQPAVKSVQDKLIEPKLRLAYSYARKWATDTADIGAASGNMRETTTSFFDLLTYNAGRQGLWVPHVRAFRSQFASNREIIDFIADWTISCKTVVKPRHKDTRLYNTAEAAANAQEWKKTLVANPSAFTDNQTNLLIFGYLRALRSNGDNKPDGFSGIYQADVMLRRGAVALGVGTIRGKPVQAVLK